MDVYLIRHPHVAVDPGMCYGRSDVPLSDVGERAIAQVARRLPPLGCVYSSPLARCTRLARYIADAHATPLVIDARWSELDFGDWEGRRWADLDRTQTEAWLADYANRSPPRGESYGQLYRRVTAALSGIDMSATKRVAAVTHAGPIRAIIAHCLGLVPTRYEPRPLEYAGVTLLRRRGGAWYVESLDE